MKEAMLYEKLAEGKVRCNLCAHRCVISDGKKGICQVRENRGGTLYTLVYGHTIIQHVDPVEKKPLFHFYPGSTAYSIATSGCNFRCHWCQNWDISQIVHDRRFIIGEEASTEQVVAAAQKADCRSIAYTYTEPTIFFEYAYDTARLWLEVTTLVIPGINDGDGELKDTANFVAEELGVDTPWHISRFFPDYKMTDVPPTPIETLDRAREIGLEAGLRYVYVGNVPGEANTVCHKCGQILIRRLGYRILENRVQPNGRCPNCDMPVAGVGMG
ncbi:hypothetical protein B6228_04930 [Candidatus Atribacteria bacterium 4572_76]|nr:MAG: hypothetical protein B6228_04930 [Candidatus Atribacteria bacterium 4572_76]